ncbi:MAG: type II secretion system secretin GspD [Burkholderiales bacterium]
MTRNNRRPWLRRAAALVAATTFSFIATTASAQNRVTLNFVNADLDAVVRAIGHYTERTFVVDPRVKGSLSLVSEKPMSKEQALSALTAALRLQGYAIVEVGGISRVVPEADAKYQGGSVDSNRVPASVRGDQVITHVFRLKYESATNVLPVVRPLIPPNSPVSAYPNGNMLVITDFADNLRRVEKVIEALDTAPASDMEVLPLKNAIASDLAMIIVRLVEQVGPNPDPNQKITVLADPPTNSLVVRAASPSAMRMVKSLVEKLDQATAPGSGVYVVPLKNMDAVALAKTLSAVRINDPGAARATNAPGAAPQPAGTGAATTVVADPASNSLVITTSEAGYRQIRAIMDRLDVRRAQVFIECLLVEVSSDQAAEFGIQWLGGLSKTTVDATAAVGGTNFGNASQNILSGAQNIGNLGRGLNIGVIRGQVTVPGLGTVTNLGALARALESTAKGNILSTPNILTLDNEEAKIVVGQNVPFITGQFTNQGSAGGATVNPFQTIERRDVGLTMKVKPQISEGGTVKLAIYQEVSSVKDTTNIAGVITDKRSLETNVIVDDGAIVVLGGLVQDQFDNVIERVPVLGSIPILGHLFRYETRRHQKTNLMLFLRPHIVRDDSGVRVLTSDRYDFIRGLEESTQPAAHFMLPDMKGALIPEIKPGSESSSSSKTKVFTAPGPAMDSILPELLPPMPSGESGAPETGAAAKETTVPLSSAPKPAQETPVPPAPRPAR